MKTSKFWLITLITALFPAYTFFQMGMLNVLGNYWLKYNPFVGHDVVYFSSAYLYADAFMLIFSGVILDHLKSSKVIPLALFINVIGTIMLLVSQNITWLILARLIGGLGHAFALISAFRMAILLFEENKHGVVIGATLTIAILGGFIAQAPFEKFILAYGWKAGVLADSVVGIVLVFVLWFTFKSQRNLLNQNVTKAISLYQYFSGLIKASKLPANYLCGIYICLMSLPLMVYGMLWGNDYLETRYALSAIDASFASGMLFIGLIIGFPIIGWLSDRLRNRRRSMIYGALITFLLMLFFATASHLSFLSICILLLSIGFFSASQSIGYAVVGEINPKETNSSAMGFSNVILMFLTASIQLILNDAIGPTNSFNHIVSNLGVWVLVGISVFIPFGIKLNKI